MRAVRESSPSLMSCVSLMPLCQQQQSDLHAVQSGRLRTFASPPRKDAYLGGSHLGINELALGSARWADVVAGLVRIGQDRSHNE